MDHSLIKKGIQEVRYIIEHIGNRTFIIGNLGEKCGKIKYENSMQIIYQYMHSQLESSIVYMPDAVIKDFERLKENEQLLEGTTYILENLNFKPDEYGYVEHD